MAQGSLKYKLIVIGGSAGSLAVILRTTAMLALQNISVVIVVHRKNDRDSLLADLIGAKTKMQLRDIEDKDPILPGVIYLVPPDYHVLFEDKETFTLDSSEKVHFSRPSIDVVFESAAEIFGGACIGVLLSGANADGASGLKKISEAGGYTIVQDPESAEVDYMPIQAINKFKPSAVIDGFQIGKHLLDVIAQNTK